MGHTSPGTIRLNSSDNVVVTRAELSAGAHIPEEGIRCRSAIPAGHKIATAIIKHGELVRKYGQVIGFATSDISPGEHVHTHNLEAGDFARNYAIGSETGPTDYVGESAQVTFMGILRPDGRVATRNYIGVMSTVNCSASVARKIADSKQQIVIGKERPGTAGGGKVC